MTKASERGTRGVVEQINDVAAGLVAGAFDVLAGIFIFTVVICAVCALTCFGLSAWLRDE